MSLHEAMNQIKANNFEMTEKGLYIPSMGCFAQGVFRYAKRGEEEEQSFNLIVTQGLDYLVGVALKGISQVNSWYIAPFSADVTVPSTWTASNFSTNANEVTAYEALSRPEWQGGDVAVGAANSFSAKAEIKATQNGVVIRGAGMLSSATKQGTVGTLLGASRFPSAKTLDEGEILDIGYGLQISAAN